MAVVNLKISYEAKKAALRKITQNQELFTTTLMDGDSFVATLEDTGEGTQANGLQFNEPTQVGSGDAQVEMSYPLMFAVPANKTVNRIIINKWKYVGDVPEIFDIRLTGDDIKVFQNAGTYTINSMKITLKENQ